MPPYDDLQDARDLLLLVIWWYGHGYAFAWLFDPTKPQAGQVAAGFAIAGLLLGLLGLEQRRQTGRFPAPLGILIFAIPFNFMLLGVAWWVTTKLGLM